MKEEIWGFIFILLFLIICVTSAILISDQNNQIKELENEIEFYKTPCPYVEQVDYYINIDDINEMNPKIYTKEELEWKH